MCFYFKLFGLEIIKRKLQNPCKLFHFVYIKICLQFLISFDLYRCSPASGRTDDDSETGKEGREGGRVGVE